MLLKESRTQPGVNSSAQLESQAEISLSVGADRDRPAERFEAIAKNRNSRTTGHRDGLPMFQIAGLFQKGVGSVGRQGMGEGQTDSTVAPQPEGGAMQGGLVLGVGVAGSLEVFLQSIPSVTVAVGRWGTEERPGIRGAGSAAGDRARAPLGCLGGVAAFGGGSQSEG